MKVRVKTTAAAVALFAAIAGTASFAQTVNYTPGDLIIGFQAKPGSTGDGQNFLLNVGSTVAYRDGSMPLGFDSPIANIGDQLSSIYGAAWFSGGDLNWGAVGMRQDVNNLTGPGQPVNGDTRGVIYVSKEATGVGESIAWGGYALNPVVSMSKKVAGLLDATITTSGGFANQAPLEGTDGFGAIIDASLQNSWTKAVPIGGSSFGILDGTIEGSVNFATEEFIYLDIYRITPDGVTPNWIVTLALDADGNVYAVPEPSTYAALIGAAGLALVIARRTRRNKVAA